MARTKQTARKSTGGYATGAMLMREQAARAKVQKKHRRNRQQSSGGQDQDQHRDENEDDGDESTFEDRQKKALTSPSLAAQELDDGDADMNEALSELSDIPSDFEDALHRRLKVKVELSSDTEGLRDGIAPAQNLSTRAQCTPVKSSHEYLERGIEVKAEVLTNMENVPRFDDDENNIMAEKSIHSPKQNAKIAASMEAAANNSTQNAHKRPLPEEAEVSAQSKRQALNTAPQPESSSDIQTSGSKPTQTVAAPPWFPPLSSKALTLPGGSQTGGIVDELAERATPSNTRVTLTSDNCFFPSAETVHSVMADKQRLVTTMDGADSMHERMTTTNTNDLKQTIPAAVGIVPDTREVSRLDKTQATPSPAMPPISSLQKQRPMSTASNTLSETPRDLPSDEKEFKLDPPARMLLQAMEEFRSWTESDLSDESIQQYLQAAGGNVKRAIKSYLLAPDSVKDTTPTPPASNAPTLVEETLAKLAKSKKTRRDLGDVLIVLDCHDLCRSCRLSSDDLRYASTDFGEMLDSEIVESDVIQPINGVYYVFILTKFAEDVGMPMLVREPLTTSLQNCEHDFYVAATKPSDDLRKSGSRVDTKIKPEITSPIQASTNSPTASSTDWLDAYRSFFRIVSRLPIRFFEKASLDVALPKLESIALVANLYCAVGSRSPVTREIDNLFRRYIFDGVLWNAIAKEPARWLMLGLHLENEMLFKEAFVHLAGKYPNCDHNDPAMAAVPANVLESIKTTSRDMYFHRKDIDSQLLSLTVPIKDKHHPWALAAMDTWRNWIATHIRIMARGKAQPISKSESLLCGNKDDFLTLNGFYTAIWEGGDAYFPTEEARSYYKKNYPYSTAHIDRECARAFDEGLNAIKKEAETIVKPLVDSSLKGGCEALEYLTCVVVEEEHIPWEMEVKKEGVGYVDEEDDDMEF